MTVSLGIKPNHSTEHIRYTKYVPLDDNNQQQMFPYLQQSVNFIEEHLPLTNVLIHCVSANSRSPCFAIAYLIKSRKLTFQQAYQQVKSKRKIIHLSLKMKDQLKKYQLDLMNQGLRRSRYNQSMRATISQKASHKSEFQLKQTMKSIPSNRNVPSPRTNTSHSVASKQEYHINVTPFSNFKSLSNHNPELNDHMESKVCKTYNFDRINSTFQIKKSPTVRSKSLRTESRSSFEQNLPQLALERKHSSSRQEYIKKISVLDHRNQKINQKIQWIHQNFEKNHEESAILFEIDLQEVESMKEKLGLLQQARVDSRKSRLARSMRSEATNKALISVS